MSGSRIELVDAHRFPYVYLCGVGVGPKTALANQNLHVPMRYRLGHAIERTTYNGYTLRIWNAEELAIAEPMPDGWHGRARATLHCKNYRFGLQYFGEVGSV